MDGSGEPERWENFPESLCFLCEREEFSSQEMFKPFVSRARETKGEEEKTGKGFADGVPQSAA